MGIYSLKESYYLSDCGDLEYFCSMAGNYVVIVNTLITIWEVNGDAVVYRGIIEHRPHHPPYLSNNVDDIKYFPDFIIQNDLLEKISGNRYSIKNGDFYLIYDVNMPKNVTKFYDDISKCLSCFDQINAICRIDPDLGCNMSATLENILFRSRNICFEMANEYCKKIKEKYEEIVRGDDLLINGLRTT